MAPVAVTLARDKPPPPIVPLNRTVVAETVRDRVAVPSRVTAPSETVPKLAVKVVEFALKVVVPVTVIPPELLVILALIARVEPKVTVPVELIAALRVTAPVIWVVPPEVRMPPRVAAPV